MAGHRRRRWALVAAGALAAVLGGTGVAVGSALERQPSRVVGGDLPINASGTQRVAVEAYNSPAVAVSPTDARTVAVASRQDAPQFGCALNVSHDGGGTWQRRPLGLDQGEAVGCFAPDLAFGADGTLFAAFTSFGPVEHRGTVPDGLWIEHSTDGGATFSPAARVHGPSPFQARLTADPKHAGQLYLTWLDGSATSTWGFLETGSPIVAARTDDGGATWTAPVTVSPSSRKRVVAPTVVAGSGGAVYLSYLDVGDDRLDYEGAHEGKGGPPDAGPWSLVVARSDDLGASWHEAVVDDTLVPTQRFLVLFPPVPSLAVDPLNRRRVYVAFDDGRTGDADVYLWVSGDGAGSWGGGHRVVDAPRGDRLSQYLPAISVAPSGRVDVLYYDRRQDPADVMNGVSLQSSYDSGHSFTHHLALASHPFDSGVGYGSGRGMADLGSRLGIVSTNDGALAVWADTRAGTTTTNRQDLARAVIAVPGRPALKPPLRAGGFATGLLGLATMAWGWRGRAGAHPSIESMSPDPGHTDDNDDKQLHESNRVPSEGTRKEAK